MSVYEVTLTIKISADNPNQIDATLDRWMFADYKVIEIDELPAFEAEDNDDDVARMDWEAL